MEENNIKNNYKEAMEEIIADRVEKEKVIALFDSEKSSTKVTPVRHGLPKVAVAALVLACVVALGGGVVWAMGNPAIKGFLFPDSPKEFEEVYKPVGTEYIIGDHKIVFDGSVYEKAVESGYINLSLYDMDGNPVEFDTLGDVKSDYVNIKKSILARKVTVLRCKIGKEYAYVIMLYVQNTFSYMNDNNLIIKFNRLDLDENYYEGKEFKFTVLNKEQWASFNEELEKMDENDLCRYTYNRETDKMDAQYDIDSVQPEVYDILSKYNLCGVESIESKAQIIDADGLKLTIGRADMIFDYNENNCQVENFSLKREDGTEIGFERKASGLWDVTINGESMTERQFGGGVGDTDTGDFKVGYNFGFILGADEKVSVEINGKIYK